MLSLCMKFTLTAARAVPLCDLKFNYFSPALQIQHVKLTVKLAYTSTKVAICKHTLPYVHAQPAVKAV